MAKIILTQEVSGLGAAGDVVTVKDGYARNYLLPRGFAVTWTQGGEKQVESIRAARAARAKASLEEAQAIAASLAANKRTIHLGSAIKRTGEYKVTVRLHADVVANVVLDVVAAA